MTTKHWIGIGIAAVLVLWAISVQRGLVQKEERVQEAWGFVQSQYERRADLIPNLVATVRGAADFERETLEAVVDARARATSMQLSADALNDPQAMENFQAAQNQLSGALSRLLVTVERYPELRANQNFRDLQTQLEGTENRISTERNRFNTAVREYNTAIRLFPGSLLAGMLGFQQVAYFEATAGAERAPTVEF
ncbi:MAG: LemA family protein [Bacteroidetes bacterium]|nr:LemA family protein [Bacteroidota bacterium]MCH8522919.1 LemA family protein [Balneolales bacterium]